MILGWYCQLCIADIFPFNALDDDIEFANCILNGMHSHALNVSSIKTMQQLEIINNSKAVHKHIDPDRNFLRGSCKTNARYLMNSEFNALVKQSKFTSENFSTLHINARSLNRNIDSFVNFLLD